MKSGGVAHPLELPNINHKVGAVVRCPCSTFRAAIFSGEKLNTNVPFTAVVQLIEKGRNLANKRLLTHGFVLNLDSAL